MNQHGVALEWKETGFLLIGPPGCGKSTLAMALIEKGAHLIADDQVLLSPDKIATCPPVLRGKLHLRDQGILAHSAKDSTTISLIFQSAQNAGPLSQPPAIDVPIIQTDFKTQNILTVVENALSSLSLGFDTKAATA